MVTVPPCSSHCNFQLLTCSLLHQDCPSKEREWRLEEKDATGARVGIPRCFFSTPWSFGSMCSSSSGSSTSCVTHQSWLLYCAIAGPLEMTLFKCISSGLGVDLHTSGRPEAPVQICHRFFTNVQLMVCGCEQG